MSTAGFVRRRRSLVHGGRFGRRTVGVLVACVLGGLGLVAPAAPRAAAFVKTATSTQALAFEGQGSPPATYGPNEAVSIIGGFAITPCLAPGISDPTLPPVAFSDVWVIPSDSPSLKSGDVGGSGGLKTTIEPAFAGLALGQIIGSTKPTGPLDAGTYAVVYDECQDGHIGPEDAIWNPAFTVTLPGVLPPADPGLLAMKAAAEATAHNFDLAKLGCAIKDLHDQYESDKKQVTDLLTKPLPIVLFSVGYPLLIPAIGQLDACKINEEIQGAFESIAKDPPDTNYAQPSTVVATHLSPRDLSGPDIASASSSASDVALALRHSIERYQGAVAASDEGWAVAHLQEAGRLAHQLADRIGKIKSAITAEKTQLAAEPADFDTFLQTLAAAADRVRTSGLTPDDQRSLLNAGFTPSQVDLLPTRLAQIDTANTSSIAAASAAFDAESVKLDNLTTAIGTLTSSLQSQVDAHVAEVALDHRAPVADAGGPYTRTSAVQLDASASTGATPGSLVRFDWDLNGDGNFDDATGPAVTADGASLGTTVGVRVLDANGLSAVAYTPVTGASGAVTASSPASDALNANVGDDVPFSVTPRTPTANVAWQIDGNQAATGPTFTFTPTLEHTGTRRISAIVKDGQLTSQRDWHILVTAPDADADGWTANVDCNDNDPSVTNCAVKYLASAFTSGASAIGIAFDEGGNAWVGTRDGNLFRFDASGGIYDAAHLVGSPGRDIHGLTFDAGHLYMTTGDSVFELDRSTGQITRSVVGVGGAYGLATDSTTGDLVVGSINGGIYRVSNPDSPTPTVAAIGDTPSRGGYDGVAVGPDGNIYGSLYRSAAEAFAGAAATVPGALLFSLAGTSPDGIAVEQAAGRTAAIWVNGTDGVITRYDLLASPPVPLTVASLGGYGDFSSVGPDGCLYATNPDLNTIFRVKNADGSCNLAPSNAVPRVTLSPPTQSASVGGTASLTAELGGVTNATGVTVSFEVTGANAQSLSAVTDSSGVATASYSGVVAGDDTVIATASPGSSQLTSKPVTVHWDRGADQPPYVLPAYVTTKSGTAVSIPLTVRDPEGDATSLRILSQPAHGSVTNLGLGSPQYTPDPHFTGTDTFTVVANDGQLDSAPAQITVDVIPGNLPPTALPIQATTPQGVPVTVAPNASDPEGGALSFAAGTGNGPGKSAHGTVTVVNGAFAYVPDAAFVGTDGFVYTASDGTNTTSSVATVVVTPGSGNRPPVGVDQLVSTPQDTAKAVTLGASDPDGDPLSFAVGSGPSHGTLSGTAPNLTYTPNTGYVGGDSFTFTANDGLLDSSTATVTIDVTRVAPVTHGLLVSVVGSGSVGSSPAGVSCPGSCAATFASGTPVGLTATAGAGARFVGWSGDCTGTAACLVTMDADHVVAATFETVAPPPSQQEIDGDGKVCSPHKLYFDFEDVEGHRDGSFSGSLSFKSGHDEFRSRKITALGFAGNIGLVFGTGKLNDHSGFSFIAVVVDNGKRSKTPDILAFVVNDSASRTAMTSETFAPNCDGDINIHTDTDY